MVTGPNIVVLLSVVVNPDTSINEFEPDSVLDHDKNVTDQGVICDNYRTII